MLAADIFSAYTEAGLEDTQVGGREESRLPSFHQAVNKVSERFKKTFLTGGSAVPPAQMFRDFRGSKCKIVVFLSNGQVSIF